MSQDETAIGYNAFSINDSGKDEHGVTMPLYFRSFGDYKLPVYIYLTALSEKIFGINAYAVRFPSAFFGSLTILVMYFLIHVLSKNKVLSLVSAALLAITPWHIHFSRSSFEVNVALFFSMLGMLFFMKGILSKRLGILILSAFSFMLSFYCYNVTRLLVPVLILALCIYYRKEIKKNGVVPIISVVVVYFLLLIPFFVTFFSKEGASSATQALIFGSNQIAQTIEFRGNVNSLPHIIQIIFFNKWVLTAWDYINNAVGYFSSQFFFVLGSSHGNQGIGNYGMFHAFEFPLLIIGIYCFFKSRIKEITPVFIWGVLALCVASLSFEVPHATRGYFLVFPITVFTAFGLVNIWSIVKKQKDTLKNISIVVGFLFFMYSLIFYLSSYFVRFPIVYSKAWRQQDQALSNYLMNNKDKYDKVVIDSNSDFIYTSFLFYEKIPSSKYRSSVVYQNENKIGYSMVEKFDKFEFKNIDWAKNTDSGKILYVVGDKNTPTDKKLIKVFMYPKHTVAFSSDATIMQYPVEEIAYRLYE